MTGKEAAESSESIEYSAWKTRSQGWPRGGSGNEGRRRWRGGSEPPPPPRPSSPTGRARAASRIALTSPPAQNATRVAAAAPPRPREPVSSSARGRTGGRVPSSSPPPPPSPARASLPPLPPLRASLPPLPALPSATSFSRASSDAETASQQSASRALSFPGRLSSMTARPFG
jgi:hypothetical protein